MASGVRAFHCVATGIYLFSFWYDLSFVNVPLPRHTNEGGFFKGRLKFLTMWNLLLQAAFFTICVANDLWGTNEDTPRKTPLVRKVKDLILPCLAFPLSMFVGFTFWGLYFVDRELIFPRALDKFFPGWLNHIMHTDIMIFILIELFTSYRKYPTRKVGLAVLSLFMLIYLIWLHIIYAYSGFWVYPILDVLNLPLRIVFFVGLLGLSCGLYIFGEKLNNVFWAQRLKDSTKRH